MNRSRVDRLGDPVQILKTDSDTAIVLVRSGNVIYLIFQNKMVDNPTYQQCLDAANTVGKLKVIHLRG